MRTIQVAGGKRRHLGLVKAQERVGGVFQRDGRRQGEPAFGAQFRQALDNVKAVVESGGLTLDNIVYVQVYLTDMSSYAEMNRVFGEYFSRNPPARAVLGVHALPDPPVTITMVAVHASHDRGELFLAGALSEPADTAVLVFKADSPKIPEDFARNDPYVMNGLITEWSVRPWIVVIGS